MLPAGKLVINKVEPAAGSACDKITFNPLLRPKASSLPPTRCCWRGRRRKVCRWGGVWAAFGRRLGGVWAQPRRKDGVRLDARPQCLRDQRAAVTEGRGKTLSQFRTIFAIVNG